MKLLILRKLRKSAIDALLPALRKGVLSLTFSAPDRWWYLSEMANALGTSPSGLQREVDSLSQSGILESRKDGRRS